MDVKNDTSLNYILGQFRDAICIHNVIHNTIIELPPKLKSITDPQKRAMEEAITEIFLKRLITERDELIDSASYQYSLYKSKNVSTNKG